MRLAFVVAMLAAVPTSYAASVHEKLVELARDTTYTAAAAHPLSATSLGIPGFDGQLEIPTEAERVRDIEQIRRWQARLAAITAGFDTKVSLMDRDDAKLLATRLTTQLRELLVYQRDRKDYSYSANNVVHALYTQFLALPVAGRDGATPEDLRKAWGDISARLSKVPAHLAASRKMVTTPCRLYGVIGSKQLAGGIEMLKDAFADAASSQLGPKSVEYRRFLKARDSAVAALQDLESYIDAHVASWPDNYALSPETYEAALRDEELIPFSAGEIAQIGGDALAHGWAEELWLKSISQQTGRALGADSGGGLAPSGAALVGYYQERMQELGKFVTGHQIVTMPDWLGTMRVIETPAFLQPVLPGAAMDPPRLFERSSTGYYYITPPPSLEEAAARLDINLAFDSDRIKFLAAHEAVPGHFLQTSIARRHPNFIRKTASSVAFDEGWACYGQEMLVRLGLYGNNLDGRLMAAAWERADGAAAIADFKIQTGEWSFQQTVDFFAAQTGFTPDLAESTVSLMVARRPGYVVAYVTGRRQIENLMSEYMLRAADRASLRDFHDRILSYGSIPLAVLGPELLAELNKSADDVRAAANY